MLFIIKLCQDSFSLHLFSHLKKYFIKKVNRAIFNFIWNILDSIKRNTLIRKIEEDGIVVIVKSAKTSWVETLSETCLTNQVIIAELQRSTLI